MANLTQVPVATTMTLGEAFGGKGYNGVYVVSKHSDGLAYLATDTASTSVIGYSLEGGAAGDKIRVFPGIDEIGKTVALSLKNSSTSALAASDVGDVCYVEGHADAGDGFGNDWTVAKTSSNSIVCGIFRGFTGLDNSRVAVEVGRKSA